MKRTTIILIFILTGGIMYPEEPQQNKEQEAVKEVIAALLKAHAEYDFMRWKHEWINEPYIYFTYTSKEGYSHTTGEKVFEGFKNYFSNVKEYDAEHNIVTRLDPYDFLVRVYDESAWAKFRIKWTSTVNGEETQEWITFENYSFEKLNGEWKISSISAVNLTTYEQE